jgi:hypothetical protein
MVYVQPPKKNAPLTMEYLYNLVAESANDETLVERSVMGSFPQQTSVSGYQ